MDPSTWCLIVIYIGYWGSVDSLQWDVESTLELDYEGTSILMGPSGPHFELIYLVSTNYEGQIDFRFTFVINDILVIMQGCTKISGQGFWIGLID